MKQEETHTHGFSSFTLIDDRSLCLSLVGLALLPLLPVKLSPSHTLPAHGLLLDAGQVPRRWSSRK